MESERKRREQRMGHETLHRQQQRELDDIRSSLVEAEEAATAAADAQEANDEAHNLQLRLHEEEKER
jgi:hypothetical protein